MKRHINIPWFVPHEGCRHSCAFCSQKKITGIEQNGLLSVDEKSLFDKTIEKSLKTADENTVTEIAFFGGSFTGIESERMETLLSWAKYYIDIGKVAGIRISTRPDYIDTEKLKILKDYGVSAIELGVQSMSDDVLDACMRGHNAEDTRKAAALIKGYGFSLGCQMILGLPLSDIDDEIKTASEIVCFGADCARIYPIVVFEGTKLHMMRQVGDYEVPSLEDLIIRGAECLNIFINADVKVLRMGLQSSDTLIKSSEYEPAYGEYVWNKLYLNKLEESIRRQPNIQKGTEIIVYVPKGDISKVVGQHRRNITKLKENYGIKNIKLKQDNALKKGDVRIE